MPPGACGVVMPSVMWPEYAPAAHIVAIAGARHFEEVVLAATVRFAGASRHAGRPAGTDLPLGSA